MLLFALLACGSDECETVTSEVADDDTLTDLAFTAADVVAAVAGTHALVAGDETGGRFPVQLTAERGEGPALYHDRTLRTRLSQDDLDPFSSDYELGPVCGDEVEVPLTLGLVSEEAGVDLAVEAMVMSPQSLSDQASLGTVQVWDEFPLDTPTLPPPPPDAQVGEMMVHAEQGEITFLSLEWEGRGETAHLLRFPVPPAE